ncbi:hypothetical protein LROSL1_2325 [Furfurilactobacillus rossiae]|uniref:type II toxin-antitoxin system HicA family toxin n=1 Tax=Furfurilactobacillus rossiae TaxID=231049 RepID=UPI0015B93729|nr:type II toxin-antitoxin system HicA family toxin [Furfurilactobacillus rossiae]MCF6166308.1 type II toxin-antitoxin system HicA family toxin [Furfurilactobacillus rossiae]QLE65126.1 hypothetical protein LROSL1_2325 [Furfurilactobacillus rossiae]
MTSISKFPQTGRELIRLLKKYGWQDALGADHGDHHFMTQQYQRTKIPIKMSPSKLPKSYVRLVLSEAGLKDLFKGGR